LSHDTVQKWIDEGVVGAGIPRTFSMHCYHRGGVQYRFMYAPVGQQWTLTHVQWWGGWAKGKHVSLRTSTSHFVLDTTTQHDMLMHYLLDKLHCYETDHSDAL
ncbi:hypothetical protein BKA82DRAFT_3962968, partial [Pisolithus tinctorius]